jgi:TPR repeat protein
MRQLDFLIFVNCQTLFLMATVAFAQGESPEFPKLRKEAVSDDAETQNLLEHRLSFGNDVPSNSVEATQWFRKAANQGHAHAQNNLSGMYLTGDCAPKDVNQAEFWFRQVAESQSLAAGQHLSESSRCEKRG